MCGACRLIQLREPPPVSAVMPRASWIRYNEPEAHLDDFVERLLEEPRLTPCGLGARTALGLGPFEEPLLRRLAARGLATNSPNLLGEDQAGGATRDGCFPYLETWQARLNPQNVAKLAAGSERADIVSCRYLLEHCHDPIVALRALRTLMKPDGVLAVEVPDSGKFLAALDYCFPWEEHVCYFVEETFAAMAERAGYEVVKILRYPGRLEDALIGVFRVSQRSERGRDERARRLPEDQFSLYRAGLAATRLFAQSRLADVAGPDRDKVALFGIGHQAIMFVNALNLGNSIGVAADDDPGKRGCFPPGFGAPVISSGDLIENDRVALCLLAVSPTSEQKVRERLAPLHDRSVQLRSIYAGVAGSIFEGRRL